MPIRCEAGICPYVMNRLSQRVGGRKIFSGKSDRAESLPLANCVSDPNCIGKIIACGDLPREINFAFQISSSWQRVFQVTKLGRASR
jgi:hypothetical protein